MSNPSDMDAHQKPIDHTTWQWRLFLVYDVLMMLLIIANLASLFIHMVILSDFGNWIAQSIHLSDQRHLYIDFADPYIRVIDRWFIIFLMVELGIRWFIAIVAGHHRRWWFFPFIHWYEVLAIIPQLRFLRLLRAGVIAYRLHELGYKVVPQGLLARGKFYYELVMEELTSRIVLTIIGQVEKELQTSTTHHKLIHGIIDHHRQQFAEVLAEVLQKSLATALTEQQVLISRNIGQIVHQAIQDTPELTQLLRLMPIVGSRVEHLIQAIGQRLGENITQGIIAPLADPEISHHQRANPLLVEISTRISETSLDSENMDDLVASVVRESLEAIKQQVKIKQWQQLLDETQKSVTDTH